MSISSAKIAFNEQGTPVASEFDDVYFSNANGLEETRYVFIDNNQLTERWSQHESECFVVAETGFGTGLNFLACVLAFVHFRQNQPDARLRRLHFISTEKYPLSIDDLKRALAHWPTLEDFARQLTQQYPEHIAGCHRMVFEQGCVRLDLWFGDIHQSLPSVMNTPQGYVDAWFLDGFAPSKNPDMWSTDLFTQMARLSRHNATFATFTAAGFVKRGLQAAGFEVQKRPGFGRKRDMLAGKLATPPQCRGLTFPWCRLPVSHRQSIAVIGAGMAAANIAASLAERGVACDIYCAADNLADGASGNPQGGFYPQLHVEPSNASVIQATSFLYARRAYQRLLENGYGFSHAFCGVLLAGFTEAVQERQQKLLTSGHWPAALVQGLSPQQATHQAGLDIPYPSMLIPMGGWISPPELVASLCAYAQDKTGSSVHYQHHMAGLVRSDSGWEISWQNGGKTNADIVIFATGAQSVNIPQLGHLPLRFTRGQVESVPEQAPLQGLKTVLCHKGYLTPSHNGRHALGSTYVRQDNATQYRPEEQATNLATLTKAMAEASWVHGVKGDSSGRAALRCSMPDHQPAVGRLDEKNEGLYVLTGLGSRGLTTAPLMAELLVSEILGDPLPLSKNLLNALAPQRQEWREQSRT